MSAKPPMNVLPGTELHLTVQVREREYLQGLYNDTAEIRIQIGDLSFLAQIVGAHKHNLRTGDEGGLEDAPMAYVFTLLGGLEDPDARTPN